MRKVSPEIEKTLSNLAQEVWGVSPELRLPQQAPGPG